MVEVIIDSSKKKICSICLDDSPLAIDVTCQVVREHAATPEASHWKCLHMTLMATSTPPTTEIPTRFRQDVGQAIHDVCSVLWKSSGDELVSVVTITRRSRQSCLSRHFCSNGTRVWQPPT
jgi:hypothetical protein